MTDLEDIRELLLERIAGAGVDDLRESPGGHRGSCPHCGGKDRFVVEERRDGDGYYVKCHSGCPQNEILLVLELSWQDLRLSTGKARDYVAELRHPDLSRARAIAWAWNQRIPIGKLALNVGNEGAGKGVVTAWLCARWSRGELIGSLLGTPAHVLLIGDEDALDDTWTPRLHLAGADFNYVHLQVEEDIDIDLTESGDVEHLRALIRKSGARVVVFDALLDHIGGVNVDEFKPKAVRGALRPLRRLAREEDVAVLGTMHPRKGRVISYRDLIANSHQFNAVSRSSLLLAKHPDDAERRVLAWGKGNHAGLVPTLEFRVEPVTFTLPSGKPTTDVRAVDWQETTVTLEQAIRASTGTGEREQRLNEKREAVFGALTDEPQSVREIAAAAEVPKSTTDRLLHELEEQEEAVQTDAGWKLKPEVSHSGEDSGTGQPVASLRARARKPEPVPSHKSLQSGTPAAQASESAANGAPTDAELLLRWLEDNAS